MTEQEQKDLTRAFQKTFSGPDGQTVLTHMLNKLGFFATDGTQDPKLVSFGNWILMEMGVYSTDETLQRYVARITGKEDRV